MQTEACEGRKKGILRGPTKSLLHLNTSRFDFSMASQLLDFVLWFSGHSAGLLTVTQTVVPIDQSTLYTESMEKIKI